MYKLLQSVCKASLGGLSYLGLYWQSYRKGWFLYSQQRVNLTVICRNWEAMRVHPSAENEQNSMSASFRKLIASHRAKVKGVNSTHWKPALEYTVFNSSTIPSYTTTTVNCQTCSDRAECCCCGERHNSTWTREFCCSFWFTSYQCPKSFFFFLS